LTRILKTTTIKLAMAPVFAALVCVVTLVLVANIPATNGYFNVGETVIYVAALLFGPLVGAFAGGIGAMIADLLVAPVFAPATLIIKCFEGAIVGFLHKKGLSLGSKFNWRICTTLLAVLIGMLLALTGSIYYKELSLYLGFPAPTNPTTTLLIPAELWYFLGMITAVLIIVIGLKVEPELGQAIFSIIVGGLEMVIGYFLYEQLVLGITVAAAEIAANIGQMLIGLVVAIPVARIVLRSLPQLKS
jgi:uncharacterized membrane protein